MFDAPLVESRDSALMSKLEDADVSKLSGKEQHHDVLQENNDDTTQEDEEEEEEEASASEEDGGWLGGFAADFRTLAFTVKGVVPPTFGAIGGAADFVHRSAMKVAQEIAKLECEERDEDDDGFLPFPWEVPVEGETPYDSVYYEEDEALKAKIKDLSNDRSTFLGPYSVNDSTSTLKDSDLIVLDEPRIHLIRCLLESDDKLATAHAHLSGRSDVQEKVIWTNYFYHCDKVKKNHFDSKLNAVDGDYDDDDRQSSSFVSTTSVEERSEAEVEDFSGATGNGKGAGYDEEKSHQSSNSLIPADDSHIDSDDYGDEDSYICVNSRGAMASPPCSSNSVGDLVLVNNIYSVSK